MSEFLKGYICGFFTIPAALMIFAFVLSVWAAGKIDGFLNDDRGE